MRSVKSQPEWGVILCKHCNAQVATLDTRRVAVYYGVCDRLECRSRHLREAASMPLHPMPAEGSGYDK